MLLNIKKINIQDNGIYILDENLKREIKKKKLSASLIDGWLKSPADWILNTYIYPLVSDKKETALYRGSMFHLVMEKFFALPSKERTKKNILEIAKEVYTSEEFAKQVTSEDKPWLLETLKQYFEMNYDYQNEKIASLYVNGSEQSGIELCITGKLGESDKQIIGFIDKVLEGPNGLIIQDWKTGAKVNNYDPKKTISESNPFDYWRQQTMYAMLLEKKGFKVGEASLIFPKALTQVDVDIHSDKVKKQVVRDVEQVSKEIDEAIENNFYFPFKKGKYNKWSKYCLGWPCAYNLDINHEKFKELALLNGQIGW